ncbi:MAG: hypothetical protein J7502_15695 [Flavisolibacter sp.]|nr:hypothetical protein [Flavisolibacter sp.]
MPGTQHRNFKSQWLAVLFLFFNCICAAAPVLKLTDENHTDAVSIPLVQVPTPLENEEENRAATSGYINHANHFSLRKHCDKRVDNSLAAKSTVLVPGNDLPTAYIHKAGVLPLPGNYAFLFRYTLF